MSDLEIAVARQSEMTAVANLMQLYIHDFSELWAGTTNGERTARRPVRSAHRYQDTVARPAARRRQALSSPQI